MAKKLKKNGLVEGSMISYISIVITKILGVLYVIPFYAVIGAGEYIYTSAYTLYNLVLNASTSGVPTAMSILVADYNTRGRQKTKQKLYRVGLLAVGGISIAIFLILQIFAGSFAGFYMSNMADGAVVNHNSVANAIRAVSVCLLFAPFLSVKRGYLQGHNYIAHSSYSQVVEQIVRIAVALGGAYFVISILGFDVGVGVNVALIGAAAGAAIALLYLQLKTAGSMQTAEYAVENERVLSTKSIIFQILRYSIPVVIVATSTNLYEIVDMKLIVTALSNILNYPADATQAIASTMANWTPKICMLVSALSMGLTASMVPSITSSYAKKKYGDVNRKFVLSINTIIVVALPLAIGLSMLSKPVYTLFYSNSEYGATALKVMCFSSVIASVKIVVCMALQALGRARLVCGCTLLGLLINALLDLPMILLFNVIGLPPYLGAIFASILGFSATIAIAMRALKKNMHFRYVAIVRTLIKAILPCAALIASVLLLKLIIPIPETRGIMLILVLGLFGIVGASVYGLVAYKMHLIQDVFGENFLDTILRKLHLKRG
ncbi:MAG: oligosaccharide flippase family protein [Acutalibacteraceae bacterium]|nr:oligosaccharide flippase family protein [Acutalibacteraceae bacterium]